MPVSIVLSKAEYDKLQARVDRLERFITEGEDWPEFLDHGSLTKHIGDTIEYEFYVCTSANLERQGK
jgi:hypothetical protein